LRESKGPVWGIESNISQCFLADGHLCPLLR
jgi:hypothetical protein